MLYLINLYFDYFIFTTNLYRIHSDNSRIISFNGEGIEILYCLFENLYSTSTGGAISLNNININCSIEYSSFYLCSSDLSGGGIYILSTSSIILSHICSNKCYMRKEGGGSIGGQFLFLSLNLLIKLNLISQTFSSYSSLINNKPTHHASRITNGNQIINSLNSSFNQLSYFSSFYFITSKPGLIQYTNFINNFALQYTTITIESNTITFNKINFFNNSQNSNSYGLIRNHNSLTYFNNSYFNSLNLKLFSLVSGKIYINNCYFKYNENINGISYYNTFNLINILEFTFLNTNLCKGFEYSKINKFKFKFLFKLLIILILQN